MSGTGSLRTAERPVSVVRYHESAPEVASHLWGYSCRDSDVPIADTKPRPLGETDALNLPLLLCRNVYPTELVAIGVANIR